MYKIYNVSVHYALKNVGQGLQQIGLTEMTMLLGPKSRSNTEHHRGNDYYATHFQTE